MASLPSSLSHLHPLRIAPLQQLLAEEEEAASRGWGWRRPVIDLGLGLGLPSASLLSGKLLPLPELAAAVCACPSRSYVLGRSGAVYSARWYGRGASLGPSTSPWTSWIPASGGQRVIQISALSSHVLLCTADGSAMAFGDPQDGKLGFAARSAVVGTPRAVESLKDQTVGVPPRTECRAAHQVKSHTVGMPPRTECRAAHQGDRRWAAATSQPQGVPRGMPWHMTQVVGVAAGGRHSLFLTDTGQCLAVGCE